MFPVLALAVSLFVAGLASAQTAPSITVHAPLDGQTVDSVQPIAFTATDPAGIQTLKVEVEGLIVPGLATAQNDITARPQDFSKNLYALVRWDTKSAQDGEREIRITVTNATGSDTVKTLRVVVLNRPAPPPPAPQPGPWVATTKAMSSSASARSPIRLKLVDGSTGAWIHLKSLMVYSNIANTVRLISGTGTLCEDNTENLTTAFPIAAGQAVSFPDRPVPSGRSLCWSTTSPGAIVRGDVIFRLEPVQAP